MSVEAIRSKMREPQPHYAIAKEHSKSIDSLLGLNCEQIEAALLENNPQHSTLAEKNLWYGLDVQTLQTPYSEILEMIEFIKPISGSKWVDLGAGYGRMGFMIGLLRSDIQFVGYELDEKRVEEGNRILKKWDIKNSILQKRDIADDQVALEAADLFFVYDFGSKNDVYKVLEKLRMMALKKPIKIIARGRGVRSWIFKDYPWLCEIHEPVHFTNWTYFQS